VFGTPTRTFDAALGLGKPPNGVLSIWNSEAGASGLEVPFVS